MLDAYCDKDDVWLYISKCVLQVSTFLAILHGIYLGQLSR